MAGTSTPNERPPTARGDRDGRRRDVLDAAASILEEVGWDGLSIRAVASQAGVSTGAVYQWFSGKDEIFAELMNQRMLVGGDQIESIPADTDLKDTVALMVHWVLDLYLTLGRYQQDFAVASRGRPDRAVAPAVLATYAELGGRADAQLERGAAVSGVRLVDHPHRVTWLWACCAGLGDRLIAFAQTYGGEGRDELVDFGVEALTRSLIAPDA